MLSPVVLSAPRETLMHQKPLRFRYLGKISPVLRVRIRRIPMFFGLLDPDPDPLVKGTDPDPLARGTDQDPSIINQNSKKNLTSYCFVTSF
jgi:hypothetical protein